MRVFEYQLKGHPSILLDTATGEDFDRVVKGFDDGSIRQFPIGTRMIISGKDASGTRAGLSVVATDGASERLFSGPIDREDERGRDFPRTGVSGFEIEMADFTYARDHELDGNISFCPPRPEQPLFLLDRPEGSFFTDAGFMVLKSQVQVPDNFVFGERW